MFGLGFMGVGTMHYLYYGAKLRGPLGLGRAAFAWVIVTSLTGFATWTASVYMLLHKVRFCVGFRDVLRVYPTTYDPT